MIHGVQTVIMYAGVCALAALALIAALSAIGGTLKAAARRTRAWGLFALAVACIVYGARKGRVTVSDPYIVDAGSYLTNDVAHVAISKRVSILPDDTEILVYARQVDSTNVTDWVRLTPHLTFAEHPYDYALANATNYDVTVAANYTPAPTVHTNGVWMMKGFVIPGTDKAAFPNTRTIRKETP